MSDYQVHNRLVYILYFSILAHYLSKREHKQVSQLNRRLQSPISTINKLS